jgi:hypothetical protein
MATLTALEDEIKKVNNETEEKPTYLAICQMCADFEYGTRTQLVSVYTAGTIYEDIYLQWFENTLLRGDIFGDKLTAHTVISLNDYVYQWVSGTIKTPSARSGEKLTRAFDNLITKNDKFRDAWPKQTKQLKIFFEKYINKFIQYTYNSSFLQHFYNLYEIYDTVYCNSRLFNKKDYKNYIEKYCSPVFKYYIMCKNSEVQNPIIFLKNEEKLTLQYLEFSLLDEKHKDNIYILENENFKKFNYYKNSTNIDYDDLYNGDKVFVLVMKGTGNALRMIINENKEVLINLLIELSKKNRSIHNLFIIDAFLVGLERKGGIKFENNDKKNIFENHKTIIDDLKNVKLIYVKGNINKLYYKKEKQYFKYNKWADYLTHLADKNKSGLESLLENINEENINEEKIFNNDRSVIGAGFSKDQQLEFFKEINDTLENWEHPLVNDFLKNFFEFNKENKLYANDISFHRKYINFSPKNYVENKYYLNAESIELEIIFVDERDWWHPYIRWGGNDKKMLKLPRTFSDKLEHYKSWDRIPENIVHIYIELINENNENILSDIAIKSLSKLITDYPFSSQDLESILLNFYIINDLNEKLIHEKKQNEKQKLIKILIDKLDSISKNINQEYLLLELINHVDDNHSTTEPHQSYIDELNQKKTYTIEKIKYITKKIEHITENIKYVTENKIFINSDNFENIETAFYKTLLKYLEEKLDTERKQKLEHIDQVEDELREQEILKQKNIRAQETRTTAEKERESKIAEQAASEAAQEAAKKKLAKLETEHEVRLAKLAHAREVKLAELETEHKVNLEGMKKKHIEDLEKEQNEEERARMILEWEQTLADEKEKYKQQLEAMKSELAKEIQEIEEKRRRLKEDTLASAEAEAARAAKEREVATVAAAEATEAAEAAKKANPTTDDLALLLALGST